MKRSVAALFEDELQGKIEKLLQALTREAELEKGIFRNLCWLAREAEVAPQEFCELLIRAGMRGSRASEIKVVLLIPPCRDHFIAEVYSWKEALAKAREFAAQLRGFPAVQTAANKLAALMHRNGLQEYACSEGRFTLVAVPVELQQ